ASGESRARHFEPSPLLDCAGHVPARAGTSTVLGVLAATLIVGSAALAEDKSGDLVQFRQLSLELASEIAWNALKACRGRDSQVAVAVVDRGGRAQGLPRRALARPHTPP